MSTQFKVVDGGHIQTSITLYKRERGKSDGCHTCFVNYFDGLLKYICGNNCKPNGKYYYKGSF